MPTVLYYRTYPYSTALYVGSPVRSGFKMYVYGYISDHLNPLAIRMTIRLLYFHIRMNSNMPVRQRDCGYLQ